MLTNCLVCKKMTENREPHIKFSKTGRRYLASTCSDCGRKKSKFVTEHEFRTLRGEGVLSDAWDKVKNTADAVFGGVRTDAPPSVRSLLKRYGNEVIEAMVIVRKPVESYITKIANFFSGGKFDNKMRELGYDDIYHLMSYVKLASGWLMIEKNQTEKWEKVSAIPSLPKDASRVDVKLSGRITLWDLITGAEAIDKKAGRNLHVYDAVDANCQRYILSLLESGDWVTAPLKTFIMQDAASLTANNSTIKAALKGVTDLANRVNVMIEGRGFFKDLAQEISRGRKK